MSEPTHVLIVGASVSGLACAASLRKQNIDFTIIEKHSEVATPWRNHYERLHLHTNKRVSNLPYKKFASSVPRYPSRMQVVEYLEDYKNTFNIQPVFNTEAKSIKKLNDVWLTETSGETFHSKFVIVATGVYNIPKAIDFKGMNSFPGKILHSSKYKTGKDFTGKNVLVVGFGNSACEIAIDLFEQGALPAMAVRSPINVIPRDVLGIPILELSLLMKKLPPRIADSINAPILRLLLGDVTKLGLKKMSYGPLEQIKKDGTIPLLDIGTIRHIRQGHIKIFDGIDFINGKNVNFKNGKHHEFDAIVAAIGFEKEQNDTVQVTSERIDDLNESVSRQKYFGQDGLYFCGFWVSPTGQFREIASDAILIAKDIARRESQ